MLTIRRLAAIAALAGSAMCQATITNLGGSCWSMPYVYPIGQTIFEPTFTVTAEVLTYPFGPLGPHLTVSLTSQTFMTLLMVGYTNQNQLLSDCGCTLFSSVDYTLWMVPMGGGMVGFNTQRWFIPPGLAGANLYLQGLFIHLSPSGADFDCHVAGIPLHVSNGFRVVFQ